MEESSMIGFVAGGFFLTRGKGEASTELNAFDAALLDAGVGDLNLLKMSSILPPGARETRHTYPKGALTPLAYGDLVCDEPGVLISAAVAVGIPEDSSAAGLIMERSMRGPADVCERAAREMVREGMETIRGLRIREIMSVSVSHTVTRVGAVFAAVVLCP
jgi:arginine decarboxylase